MPSVVAAWARSRAGTIAALLGLAVAVPVGSSRLPARDEAEETLRAALADRHALHVAQGDLSLQRPDANLAGALWGEQLLFLGTRRVGAPRDLYRAVVRRAPNGRVVSIGAPTNLTRTAIGDEHGLSVHGPWAAFATRAYGHVQAIEILDLRGEPASAVAPLSRLGRAQQAVTSLIETGELEGLGRTIVRLEPAPSSVRLAWRGDATLDVATDRERFSVDAANGRLRGGAGATAERVVHDPKPSVLWAVDTVRALVGAAPIAWLEARTFALADFGRRLQHGALHPSPTVAMADVPRRPSTKNVNVGWPPPPIAPRLSPPADKEGVWIARVPSFVKRLPGAPPAFFETFTRPDPERPYVRAYLVAMDMRQLSLDVVAGAEDPAPTVGPPGTGRLPHNRDLVANLVAAFNGAFKTKHGEYGMVENGRILLPPLRHAATILTRNDGRIGIGSWPGMMHVPPEIVSLRQNLDPLVDRGVLNPVHRRQWGFPLPGMESMQTTRSGVCIDRGGNLLYFYGTDLSSQMLGETMLAASCSYGIHLDMNPSHCAFVYAHVRDPDAWFAAFEHPARTRAAGGFQALYDAQTVARGMMDPKRYLVRSPKDFFYLTLRPAMLENPSYRLDGGSL